MNIVSGSGLALTVGGVLGYIIGVSVQFPGRALTVTSVMVGVTLLAVGRSDNPEVTA